MLTKCGMDGLNFCMSTPSSFFKKLSFSEIVLRSIRPAGKALLCLKSACMSGYKLHAQYAAWNFSFLDSLDLIYTFPRIHWFATLVCQHTIGRMHTHTPALKLYHSPSGASKSFAAAAYCLHTSWVMKGGSMTMQSKVWCMFAGMSSGLLKSYTTKLGSLLHCLSRSNKALFFLSWESCSGLHDHLGTAWTLVAVKYVARQTQHQGPASLMSTQLKVIMPHTA